MPELILVLFKINLVLLLFAAAYYLVLRRLTFYTLNRVFLVIGIVFSTVYPFINLTDFFRRQEQINPKVAALVPTIDMKTLLYYQSIAEYWQIVVILFYVGVSFMAIRLVAQFISLYKVHRLSRPGAIGDMSVRILNGKLSPFSFWQTVYVNPEIHSEHELSTILAHEQVHVKQWHTLDIILAEISVVFYWFNPGVWLMKRAIKENIEFITDAKIVKNGADKKAYQYSLLGVGSLQTSVALVNNFNLSDLKKRIKMMNTKRSSPRKLLIYVVVLPILLLTTLAFTVNNKEVKQHLIPLQKAITETNLFKESSVAAEVVPVSTSKSRRKVKEVESKEIKKDITKDFRYVINTLMFSDDSLHIAQELPEEIKQKIEALRGITGKATGIKLTNVTFTYKQGDSVIGSEKLLQDEPIVVEGKKMIAQGSWSATKDIKKFKAVALLGTSPSDVKEVIVQGFKLKGDTVSGTKVNYIYDGKPLDQKQLNKVNPNNIKSVTLKKVDSELTNFTIISKKD